MAQVVIDIPDPQIPRIRAALADQLGKAPGDVTVGDLKDILIQVIRTRVRGYERDVAAQQARDAVTEINDMT